MQHAKQGAQINGALDIAASVDQIQAFVSPVDILAFHSIPPVEPCRCSASGVMVAQCLLSVLFHFFPISNPSFPAHLCEDFTFPLFLSLHECILLCFCYPSSTISSPHYQLFFHSPFQVPLIPHTSCFFPQVFFRFHVVLRSAAITYPHCLFLPVVTSLFPKCPQSYLQSLLQSFTEFWN